ncbi:Hypothetical protein POVR2_LOCUS262 [uncultured virus]|nr:Hypothetical protein POVR2_LOCUS262 [uncultured virus]
MMMLCSACRDMQFEVVQLLLEHSLLDERLLKDELTVRVLPRTLESTDSILMVSLLLLARVMTPVTYYVIMNNVTVYGYVEVLKMLLLHPRIDPACNRSACLKYACMSERAEVVRLLLDDGRVDVTEDSIHHGLSGCNIHPEILELLLSNPIVAHSDKCAGLRQVLRRATLARRVRDAGL